MTSSPSEVGAAATAAATESDGASEPSEMSTTGGRVDPPRVGDERTMLEGWLDWHRSTLLHKCEDLDDASRKARPVESSLLSLHGLVRHMAEVERGWFQQVLRHRPDTPSIWWDPAIGPDSEMVPLGEANWEDDVATWKAECEASRRTAASHSLDDIGAEKGKEYSLRWIYLHMIEEYARHNGHADLIRELIDGTVGE